MIYIYMLGYIAVGLGVAKCFQKWVNTDVFNPPLDAFTFVISIIVWPFPLFVLIIAGFAWIITWFFNLGNKK